MRLRLLNATAGDHLRLALLADGEPVPVHLLATDVGLLERAVVVTEVLLAPGERAEVVLDATVAGSSELVALPYSVYGPGGEAAAQRVLAVLRSTTGLQPVRLPDELGDVAELDLASAVRTRRLVLGADGAGAFTIDGATFDHSRVDIQARLGTLELWDVVNDHGSDHPFHLHSYAVQVVDRDGVPEPFRAWRDTVNVPAGSTVRLAVPLRGEPGRTVYHCHIASHEDLGMMGVLEVLDEPGAAASPTS